MNVVLLTDLYPESSRHTQKDITWAVHELAIGLGNKKIIIKKVIRPTREILWKKMKRLKYFSSSKVDFLPVDTRSFFNLPKKGFFLRKSDIRYLTENLENIDLVISHMNFGASLANIIYKKFNIPFVYIMHEGDFRTLNRQSDIFQHALSIYTRSVALDAKLNKFGIKSDGVIYSGIDAQLIVKRDFNRLRQEKIFKFISVNRLEKRKNIDKTLEVLAQLPKNIRYEYIIIGDGSERKNLENKINYLGLGDTVKMLGFKDRSFCLESLRKSDVFIMPSDPETFGLAYLEAMASGCLVICAKGCGVDGLIVNNFDGYAVEARDVQALKNVLINICTYDQSKILENSYLTIQKYTLENAQLNYAEKIKLALKKH